METPQEQLDKWFLRPLEQIRDVSSGNSFFIELLTACVLYERHTKARLARQDRPGTTNNVTALIQSDFDATPEAADAFWQIIRAGLAHQAMPAQKSRGKSSLPGWFFHDSYPNRTPIRLEEVDGEWVLKVQPRVFVDRVIQLWRESPELIAESQSFPWPRDDE